MSTADREQRSPAAVWDRAASIDHHTFVAVARGYRADRSDAPTEADTGVVTLTPYLGQNEGNWFVISLRASAKLSGNLVEFEEAARISLEADLALTPDELQEFGAEYILPFLLPYVESGFTRMCREVGEEQPQFPFITMQGQLITHPAYAETHAGDQASEYVSGKHASNEATTAE